MAYIKIRDINGKETEHQVINEDRDVSISIGFSKFKTLGDYRSEIESECEGRYEDDNNVDSYMNAHSLEDIIDDYDFGIEELIGYLKKIAESKSSWYERQREEIDKFIRELGYIKV